MILASEILNSFVRIILCVFFITREKPHLKTVLISAAGSAVSCAALFFTDISDFVIYVCEIAVVLLCLYLSNSMDRRKNLFFCGMVSPSGM